MPPLRVEIFGPMGAGKSTLSRAIQAHPTWRALRPGVSTAREEKRKLTLELYRKRSTIHRLELFLLRYAPRLREALLRDAIPDAAVRALRARSKEFGPLMDHILNGRRVTSTDPADTFKRTIWTLRDLADLAMIEEYSQRELILYDESILQRGLGLSFDDREGDTFFSEFCELIPLPNLLISMTTELDDLARRIQRRGNRAHRAHLEHIESAHARAGNAVRILAARGCQILEIDGAERPRESAARCCEVMEGMLEVR